MEAIYLIAWTILFALPVVLAFQLISILPKEREINVITSKHVNFRNLNFDPDFLAVTRSWLSPTLDTTYYAFEMLARIDGSYVNDNASQIEALVWEHYDEETGFFYSDRNKKSPSIVSTHCAVGLLKIAQGEFMQAKDLCELDGYEADRWVRTKNSSVLLLNDFDNTGSVSSLYSCLTVLKNLGVTDRNWKERLPGIVEKLRYSGVHGEALKMSNGEACISALYFFQRLLPKFDLDLFTFLDKEKVSQFVNGCYENGSFSSNPWSKGNVLHTRMAYVLTSVANLDVPRIDEKELLSYVSRCRTSKGYSYQPGTEPNLYATRNALELLCRMENDLELALKLGNWTKTSVSKMMIDHYGQGKLMTGYPDLSIRERFMFSPAGLNPMFSSTNS